MKKFIRFLENLISKLESKERFNELYLEIKADHIFSKYKLANIFIILVSTLIIPIINIFISLLMICVSIVTYLFYIIPNIILMIYDIQHKLTIKKKISKIFTNWEIEVKKNTPDIKLEIDKSIILKENENFKDFIYNFFVRYNYAHSTLRIDGSLYCRTNRRRSLGDIYLICNYYFPNTKMEDIFKYLLENRHHLGLSASRCGEIHKIVFYITGYTYWRDDITEFSNDTLTLGEVLKYYNR